MKNYLNINLIFIPIFYFCLVSILISEQAVNYEKPQNRKASSFLNKELLKGPHYQIRENVVTYGYMDHFTVESDYDVFEVTGDHALIKLLKEIAAITELKKIQDTDAYVQAVKQAGKAPIDFGASLITDPVDTVSSVPKGAFSMLHNIKEGITSDSDPSEDSTTKQILAVSSTKRQYAYDLGVDVYSSNPVLQKELNRIGWAAAIGGLSVSIATLPLGGAFVVIKAAKMGEQLRNTLKDYPPSKLRIINKEKLIKMEVPEELTESFLNHPNYTPWHDTIITATLFRLGGTTGISNFVTFALSANDEVDANFVTDMAQTLRNYHLSVEQIKTIKVFETFVLAETKSGKTIIPFPLDHGVWTRRAEKIFDTLISENPKYKGKFELWVTGTLSDRAKKELSARQIKVMEDIDKKYEYIY